MRAFCFLMLLPLGCGTVTGVDGWDRRLGVIDPALSSIQMLQLPSQVEAGVPFSAVVHTLGSGTCTQVLSTEAIVDGLTAHIRPYDLYARPRANTACTDDLRPFRHEVTLTLTTPGTAQVIVHGRNHQGDPVVYDQAITVRPATGAEWARRRGVIDASISSVPVIQVPGPVFAGVPFRVIVSTFGSSSCTRTDGETVAVTLNTADITPWDRYAPAGSGCTADVHRFEHHATLTFATAGEARVRVHGRSGDGRDVTHTVVVPVRSR